MFIATVIISFRDECWMDGHVHLGDALSLWYYEYTEWYDYEDFGTANELHQGNAYLHSMQSEPTGRYSFLASWRSR